MPPPPRLKHVAEAAGVSVITFSLALRNHSSLPARTHTRIQKIATNLGYRPDPNISQLMERVRGKKQRQTGTVLAYPTSHEDRFGWKEKPTQRDYHDRAARRADELGYSLEEFWLRSSGMTELRLSQILRNRGIEGVIVAPLPPLEIRIKNSSGITSRRSSSATPCSIPLCTASATNSSPQWYCC